MKIAITSDLYHPMINGVAVFAHNLAKGLAKQGHEVMVICPSFTGKHHEENKDGVKVVYCRSIRFPLYPDQINKVPDGKKLLGVKMPRLVYRHGIWVSLFPYLEVRKALKKFKPDVVHLQTAEGIAIATMRFVHVNDVPLVSTGHAYPDNVTGQIKLFKLLKPVKVPVDMLLKRYMASFLKHSEYATMPTELAIGDLIPKNRRFFKVPVEALSNGVDLSQFTPGKAPADIYKKYGLDPKKPRVLYVGRVDPEKSISNIVKAFEKIKVKDAELVIVGDGTDKAHLVSLVKSLGLENRVKFLGKIVPPELCDVYKIGDVFATASETETQGIVLIEAAATGLPLIAVDDGAVKELCQHRKNGILCKPGGDIDGLTKAMNKILSDKDLRDKYSNGSLEVASKHDLNHTLARFEEIYNIAIDSKLKK